ncbi:hypothetical protein [Kineosporia sp. NBRC 101677]|uniref:hypothetical protein n=1 Tax=Kineosporia sp. NBRC 101677 TaxID=3032197 RepID=UPI0025553FAC|nr:hypothetical protein [Kineosporia sp. NBRC 101677]
MDQPRSRSTGRPATGAARPTSPAPSRAVAGPTADSFGWTRGDAPVGRLEHTSPEPAAGRSLVLALPIAADINAKAAKV